MGEYEGIEFDQGWLLRHRIGVPDLLDRGCDRRPGVGVVKLEMPKEMAQDADVGLKRLDRGRIDTQGVVGDLHDAALVVLAEIVESDPHYSPGRGLLGESRRLLRIGLDTAGALEEG